MAGWSTTNWLDRLMGPTVPVSKDSALTLIERIKSGSRADKRKAIGDLKKISTDPQCISVIGADTPLLINYLKTEKEDPEGTTSVLEIFQNISSDPTNIQLFLKDPDNVLLLFQMFEESDRSIQYQTAKFLSILMEANPPELQAIIIANPQAIIKLIEFLRTPPMIRNEILLLLKGLTEKGDQEINTIIAFAELFTILFEIMIQEKMIDGGIIVQDCLQIINNLCRGGQLIIRFFRESGFVGQLKPLVTLQNPETDVYLGMRLVHAPRHSKLQWVGGLTSIVTEDRVEILCLALDTISALVTCPNPQEVYTTQTQMAEYQILDSVITLALVSSNSPSIRSRAVWALGHLILDHAPNRRIFRETRSLQQSKDQNPIFKIFSIAINSKVTRERRAAVHALQCFLWDNPQDQETIAATVLPTQTSIMTEDEDSPGRLLYQTIGKWDQETDHFKTYFGAVILSYVLQDNRRCKEILLKNNAEGSNLLLQVMDITVKSIQTNCNVQIQIGLLRLLTLWLNDCSSAVKALLQAQKNIQFLTSLISSANNAHVRGLATLVIGLCAQDDDSGGGLDNAIGNSIGIDKYLDNLSLLIKSDEFTNCEQFKGQPNEDYTKWYYDSDYCFFFQRSYDQILRRVRPVRLGSPVITPDPVNTTKLIEECILKQKQLDTTIADSEQTINRLQKELSLLGPPVQDPRAIEENLANQRKAHELKQTIEQQQQTISKLEEQLEELKSNAEAQDDLLVLIAEQSEKMKELKKEIRILKNPDNPESSTDSEASDSSQ